MAGPFIEAANRGISDEEVELNGEQLSHSDLLNILNHHAQTQPSSSPTALMGNGLPWHYKADDSHIAGVQNMAKHILDHEGPNGELASLVRQQVNGDLENTLE